ncbi:DUF4136 domain-containing protein [Christiangramia sp. SM2212]|uniref:DUF4136 domain-containing protein n=1 Tax=Christiangramia sediminicola TaxID=3073267 RepID=A0ABU1ESE3_9FLAO|nr:DUF4136 domain-containing protein [Christiangramia sp. SM2212]MDR5590874.1 DUF4136 domain-containing protein [Christiangramia sp. SM2212]
MKFLKVNLLIVVTIIMASCGSSGPTVKDDVKKLKSYDSYAYLPNKDTIISRDYDNDAINSTIIETINANMRENGFRLDKLQPDVLVYVHPMFDEQVAVNANPVYTNYPYYRPGLYVGPYYRDFMYDNYFTIQRINGPRVKQVPYRERTIVIDFIDRRTNEILWRGTTDETIATRRIERETREYVDEIFKALY